MPYADGLRCDEDGSKANNAILPMASAGMNLRLPGNDTMESAKTYVQKVIRNEKIEAGTASGNHLPVNSDTGCEAWKRLTQAVADIWPEAIVFPYLMMAGSDSKNYCRISDKVYRFSAMRLSKEDAAGFMGIMRERRLRCWPKQRNVMCVR